MTEKIVLIIFGVIFILFLLFFERRLSKIEEDVEILLMALVNGVEVTLDDGQEEGQEDE